MAHTAEAYNYLVISDLHLQEADKNPAGRLFYFDQEFADFLRHYRLFHVEKRRWKLIIDGDFIEFYHIPHQPSPDDKLLRGVNLTETDLKFFPGTEWQKSVWKLHLILSSHPQLLLALARFVADGNEIYILRGNHDLEFFWPEVQEHFRLLVAQHHPVDKSYIEIKMAVKNRIHFVPWFYLEKDLLYVEHGHQYDPYCSNKNNLYPVLEDNPRQLELALSAFTMRYFVSRIQKIDPAAMENVSSIPKYLTHLIRNNWRQVAAMPVYYAEMLIRTLRKVRAKRSRVGAADDELDRMEGRVREEIKAAYGLSDEKIRELDALRLEPVLLSWWSTLKVFYIDLLLGGLLVGILGSRAVSHLTFLGRWSSSVFIGLILVVILLEGKRRIGSFNDHRNLRDIARTIRETVGCRYVVFGHSHDPDACPLSPEHDQWYFNVGTWVPRRGEGQFIYLEILSAGDGTTARLMRWDRRRKEPVDLGSDWYSKKRREQKAILTQEEGGMSGSGSTPGA
jgi:UDP-2,3-diacylglucosamine pyrophosphatase LpxH